MGKLQSKFRKRSEIYRTTQVEKSETTFDSKVVQYEPAHKGSTNTVTNLSPELCVSGGSDQAVVVYDWKQGRMCQTFQGHNREVTKVVCYPGSTWIFSASRDKTVLMWDLNQGDEPIQEFCGHELVVNGLAISPEGRKLCTGSRDNWMCLWDIESAKCEQRQNVSRNLVTHVCWVPGSSSVVQTSEDKIIRVWDSRAWQVTNTFPAKQYIQTHCDVSPNGHYLLSSSNGFGGQGCEATVRPVWLWLFVGPKVCLGTLHLDGAGPLVCLAPTDSDNLLCASFNNGLHHIQLGNGLSMDQDSGASSAGAGELDVKVVACF
ncbi:WD repeat-containing protein 31 [Notothenia coriiceps]|uniref:WD repeat-containing protein 31 n=1 Tax=Notothenia coriiceps TaxID=8208 RepID=A0A6I9NIG1_9TELE|nr:PREDICTED: WD repeat-containing protein 31 [Notothenia coriiceps]